LRPRRFARKRAVQTRFLLGPAGSGKTFRTLAEIRAALKNAPQGPPLILLAPKQATFQLERQLLADNTLSGYTRLQILSFERLADFVLAELKRPAPKLLSEEGRVMVLRALLSRNKEKLKIFRASARLPGFAQQLSLLLRELQRHQITPATLLKLGGELDTSGELRAKLHDLSLLLDAYFDWLKQQHLQDGNCLLDLATDALNVEARNQTTQRAVHVAGLWLDGFAEMTPQEINLLAAFVPCCDEATLAFCLDHTPEQKVPGLSIWSVVSKTFRECWERLQALPNRKTEIISLPRGIASGRFADSPALRHLEKYWTAPIPFVETETLQSSLRLATALNPEAEATLAAHEILRLVRDGGRFRHIAVLLRQFDGYHDVLRRVFTRYEIPFFLDRRESISHHPLAELTRSVLSLSAFDWEHENWFCALKTGLVTNNENAVDQLENESLSRGWKKEAWLHPLNFGDEKNPPLVYLEELRKKVVPPFQNFVERIAGFKMSPDGVQLAEALRRLWSELSIEEKIIEWSDENPVHGTVWEQMQEWLKNITLAFAGETIRMSDWLPILESGLSGMSVGVIPPALDQVLIGTIDRSRNPDLRLVLVLGFNEGIFPAPAKPGNLFTEADQAELSLRGMAFGPNKLELMGRERFYGYIACTRARERLVLTCAAQDSDGRAKNPSPFFSLMEQLFPTLSLEAFASEKKWFESEHRCELIAPLVQAQSAGEENGLATLAELPLFDVLQKPLAHFALISEVEILSPEMAEKLYGTTLKTSVSLLEQFAACPFRFFVSAGLRAQERRVFEVDVREKGSFQHAILAKFHEQLRDEKKRWRDLSPDQARKRIGSIGAELKLSFRDGLFGSDAQNDFSARSMVESLQDFIETIIGWMQQYEFNPHLVELGFGAGEKSLPAWEINLDERHRLAFRGIIDRVDLFHMPETEEALAVIMDYKSSAKQLDAILLAHGLQLQLLAYLAFLRQLPAPEILFGAKRLIPAGVFFVNLRGNFGGGKTRNEVLDNLRDSRQAAFQHSGRFDFTALARLDNHNEKTGTQFNYRLKADGQPHGASREILSRENFSELLNKVEQHLSRMGKEIFSGAVKIDPYQKGKVRACDQCDYAQICRIDSWSHEYRVLK